MVEQIIKLQSFLQGSIEKDSCGKTVILTIWYKITLAKMHYYLVC